MYGHWRTLSLPFARRWREKVAKGTDQRRRLSSKFGKRALVRLGSLEMVTTLVTDERPDEALCQRAKAASVDILV